MMNANNTVSLAGRIAHSLELKQTDSGTPVLKFSIAVDSGKDRVDFFDCEAWKSTAEFIARYFEKGKWISVCGSLKQEKWQGRDGTNKSKIIVHVDAAGFCGGASEQKSEAKLLDVEVDDEELPF